MKNLKCIIAVLITTAAICQADENFSASPWAVNDTPGTEWASITYPNSGTCVHSVLDCPYTTNIDNSELRPRGEIELENRIQEGGTYTINFSYNATASTDGHKSGSAFFQLFAASSNGGYSTGSQPGLIIWPDWGNIVFGEYVCGKSLTTSGIPATDTDHVITIHIYVSTGSSGWLQCYVDGNHIGTIYGANATTSGGLIIKCGNYSEGVAANYHSTNNIWSMTINDY